MSYAPVNETSADLFNEETWLQGAILCSVGYGVVLALFAMCFYLLIQQWKGSHSRRSVFFLVYISIEFILASLFQGSIAKFVQLAFIEDRNFPGGPAAFEAAEFSIPVDEIGNVAFVLTNWFSDALLVWRCMIIYTNCGVSLYIVMALPCLMFLTSVSMGILWLIQICTSSPFGIFNTINWTIPFFSLSLALNILVTIAIVVRLYVYRRRVAKLLNGNHGSQYTSIAAMLVESAFLYSSFSILFLVPFGMNNPLSQIFLQALSQIQTMATLLIVFRTAQGKVWTAETQRQVTAYSSSNALSFGGRSTTFTGTTSTLKGKEISTRAGDESEFGEGSKPRASNSVSV
ncbi:hypothetical protein FB45DRAFT_1059766 [Roridomyces roridus]|uniref:Uncharacterized protein n=1 Tax=Roridomyces roridus TaxID=1738132 RepID=A0AAD7BPC6_9AGAR|nr:hypothetical protein FB45DRAFT_1059766 [Roridomyces roridus]